MGVIDIFFFLTLSDHNMYLILVNFVVSTPLIYYAFPKYDISLKPSVL